MAYSFRNPSCTFNDAEKFHKSHGHDINTGNTIAGGLLVSGPEYPESGCASAWAVGGTTDGSTTTNVPQSIMEGSG
jgi:hypothetical protein